MVDSLESTTVTENILVLQKNIHFIKVLSKSWHLLKKNNTFNVSIIFAYCNHFVVLWSLMLHLLNVNFALCWKWCKYEIMKYFSSTSFWFKFPDFPFTDDKSGWLAAAQVLMIISFITLVLGTVLLICWLCSYSKYSIAKTSFISMFFCSGIWRLLIRKQSNCNTKLVILASYPKRSSMH